MTPEAPEAVAKRLAAAQQRGEVIDFGVDRKDRYVLGVCWATYGLPESNEIVVTATAGPLCLGIAHPSTLQFPAMRDRVFGPDVDDLILAAHLASQLWETSADRLIAAARQARLSVKPLSCNH
jgi:hypothetical protein